MRRTAAIACAATVLSAPAISAHAETTPRAGTTDPPRAVTTVRDPAITESSGLAVSAVRPDVVWTVNDSGAAAVVYGVSLRTGRTVARLRLVGPEGRPLDVVDTESLASATGADGARSLLVGDIGDNRRTRESVSILRVAEPSVVRDAAVPTARLTLRYEGGPADAEALVVTPQGRVLVITKAVLRADVYEVPATAARALLAGRSSRTPVTAHRLSTIGETLVTGADALPDGRVVVRGYGSATIYGWDGDDLVAQESVELPAQQQGESIAVEPGGRTALLTSEGVRQPVWRLALPAATAAAQATPTPSAPPSSSAEPPRSSTGSSAASSPVGLLALGVLGAAGALALAAAGVRAARRRGRRRP